MPLAFHQFLHGAELQARIFLPVRLVLVETGAGGFGFHRAGGRLQGNQNADGGFLAVQHAAQIAHVLHAGLAAFDLNDDLLRLGGLGVVAEKDFAVNAVVRAFLLLDGARADEAERPPLELVFVVLGERGGFVGRGGFADDADEGDLRGGMGDSPVPVGDPDDGVRPRMRGLRCPRASVPPAGAGRHGQWPVPPEPLTNFRRLP